MNHYSAHADTCEEKLESPQKKGLVADPNECIVFDSKHLEASEIKGFEAESNFDPSTLGDTATPGIGDMKESMQSVKTGVDAHPEQFIGFSPKHLETSVIACLEAETNFNLCTVGDILGTCSMEESLQKSKNEKVDYSEEALQTTMNNAVFINDVDLLQRSMEECNLVQEGFSKLFDNSDAGRTRAEEENQPYMLSSEGEKRVMVSLGEYFLNESHSVDNSSDQNLDETLDKFAQTLPQAGQNKSCSYNIHQIFTSGIVQVLFIQVIV